MAYCRICKTKIGAVFWTLISCQKCYVTCATTDKLKRVYIELFLKYVAQAWHTWTQVLVYSRLRNKRSGFFSGPTVLSKGPTFIRFNQKSEKYMVGKVFIHFLLYLV